MTENPEDRSGKPVHLAASAPPAGPNELVSPGPEISAGFSSGGKKVEFKLNSLVATWLCVELIWYLPKIVAWWVQSVIFLGDPTLGTAPSVAAYEWSHVWASAIALGLAIGLRLVLRQSNRFEDILDMAARWIFHFTRMWIDDREYGIKQSERKQYLERRVGELDGENSKLETKLDSLRSAQRESQAKMEALAGATDRIDAEARALLLELNQPAVGRELDISAGVAVMKARGQLLGLRAEAGKNASSQSALEADIETMDAVFEGGPTQVVPHDPSDLRNPVESRRALADQLAARRREGDRIASQLGRLSRELGFLEKTFSEAVAKSAASAARRAWAGVTGV